MTKILTKKELEILNELALQIGKILSKKYSKQYVKKVIQLNVEFENLADKKQVKAEWHCEVGLKEIKTINY